MFVGEIVEKGVLFIHIRPFTYAHVSPARQVQSNRNESGPLTPDHLREAYRMYQEETGRVGSARPVRGKRLFVR